MAHVLLARTILRQHPLILNQVLYPRLRFNHTKSPPPPTPPEASSSSNGPSHPPGEHVTPPNLSLSEAPPPLPPQSALSLDFSPRLETEGSGERTGAKSAKGSLSTIERRRRFMSRLLLGMLTLGAGFGVIHLGRPWHPDELKKLNKDQEMAGRWGRTSFRFLTFAGLFSEPQWEQLLPPPLPKGEQRPYTLLLSIDDLLVTSTWDRAHGWRTAKRPGVDYFLGYLQQWFEIVIFTTQPFYTADPIIEKLDPLHALITYRLFKESTHYVDGKCVKDLSFLNRDLSRVVAVDTNPDSYAKHRTNAVVVPKWNGDPHDQGLIAIIPFLESIGIYNPPDVRPIIGAYVDKDVALEYGKFEAESKRQHLEEWERKGGRRTSAPSFLGKLLGTSSASSDKPPLSYLDRKRLEAQRNYRLDQEYLKKNEETIKKWLQDQQDANLKALGPSSLLSAFSGWGNPPATTTTETEVKPSPAASGTASTVGKAT